MDSVFAGNGNKVPEGEARAKKDPWDFTRKARPGRPEPRLPRGRCHGL